GITDLITIPGLINLDFADVRTIMTDAGSALMGIGQAGGENRAAEAAKLAISSPLLEESVEGATGVLLNITGGRDLGLFEVNEAAEIVQGAADSNANILKSTSTRSRRPHRTRRTSCSGTSSCTFIRRRSRRTAEQDCRAVASRLDEAHAALRQPRCRRGEARPFRRVGDAGAVRGHP